MKKLTSAQLVRRVLFPVLLPCAAWVQAETHNDGHHETEHRHHEAHVHGSVVFNVSQQNQDILLQIKSPGDDVLGIERDLQSKAEHQLLDQTLQTLKNSSTVIEFPKAADCQQIEQKIVHNYDDDDDHDDHHEAHHDEKEAHSEHSSDHNKHDEHDEHEGHDHKSFVIEYQMKCKNASAIKNTSVQWFKHFKNTKKIQFNMMTDKKQQSVELTPEQPVVHW